MPRLTKDRVVWCNRGYYTPFIGFCPSAEAWHGFLKDYKIPDEPYPTTDAQTTTFYVDLEKGKKTYIIVTVGDHIDKKSDVRGLCGLIAHESTHVVRKIWKAIGEDTPGEEAEAYAVQSVMQDMLTSYAKTRRNAMSKLLLS